MSFLVSKRDCESLLQAKARKAEGQRRLDDLEKDINALDSISTDQVKAERDAAAELLQVSNVAIEYNKSRKR